MDAVTSSIRMPREVRDQYETLAQATGRTRNELMVEALRIVAEQQLREIAMIQEGLAQARDGRTIAVEDVVTEFKEPIQVLYLDADGRGKEVYFDILKDQGWQGTGPVAKASRSLIDTTSCT